VLPLISSYTSDQQDKRMHVQREDDLITSHSARDGRRIIYQSVVVTDSNVECLGRDRKDGQKGKKQSRELHDAQHILNDSESTRL
jgi:hypothetical protein